jgi:putative transposase
VWLYHRFPQSLRDVEEMMAERGVSVSYDTIHQWRRKFGQTSGPTRRQVASGRGLHQDRRPDTLSVAGPWQGTVLDILVTSR